MLYSAMDVSAVLALLCTLAFASGAALADLLPDLQQSNAAAFHPQFPSTTYTSILHDEEFLHICTNLHDTRDVPKSSCFLQSINCEEEATLQQKVVCNRKRQHRYNELEQNQEEYRKFGAECNRRQRQEYGQNRKDYIRKRREDNSKKREEYNRKHREWYAQNREECNRKQREWYSQNREECNRKQREWYAQNREECSRKKREWRTQNKEKVNRRAQELRAKNKEVKMLQGEWCAKMKATLLKPLEGVSNGEEDPLSSAQHIVFPTQQQNHRQQTEIINNGNQSEMLQKLKCSAEESFQGPVGHCTTRGRKHGKNIDRFAGDLDVNDYNQFGCGVEGLGRCEEAELLQAVLNTDKPHICNHQHPALPMKLQYHQKQYCEILNGFENAHHYICSSQMIQENHQHQSFGATDAFNYSRLNFAEEKSCSGAEKVCCCESLIPPNYFLPQNTENHSGCMILRDIMKRLEHDFDENYLMSI